MLFEQIERNKRNTIWISIFFVMFVLLMGGVVFWYTFNAFFVGVGVAAAVTAIYVPISLWQSKNIVLKMNHAKQISKEDNAFLWNTVESLALVARIPMPSLYIIEEDSPNAFAAGFSPEKASIAVTTALLEKLNREEVEAVLAHEVGHIVNYDIRLSTAALALVSVIALFSDLGSRLFFAKDSDNKNPLLIVIAIALIIIAPIIAMIIQLSLSRNREFLADATGAELCRNPEALVSALLKISGDEDPVDNIPRSAASLYFDDPFKKKKRTSWFATHPSVEDRIERLRSM
ncbi:zinc metalloprotease HtpX [Bacillus luti]|nr:protease HtpX [Bacillus cereus]